VKTVAAAAVLSPLLLLPRSLIWRCIGQSFGGAQVNQLVLETASPKIDSPNVETPQSTFLKSPKNR